MLLVLQFLFLILFLWLCFSFCSWFYYFFCVFCSCCGSCSCFWSCSPCSHCFPCSICFFLFCFCYCSCSFCWVLFFVFCFSCWLFLLNLPLIHKNVYHFFCPISKNVPARLGVWKKECVRTSVAPHRNQPDSFSIDSIGHFCHALMHAQHAKYDLERPRLTTWVASQHM